MAQTSGKQKILIVDDTETVLSFTKRVLEMAGFEVIARSKPIGTGSVIIQEQPSLVLIDVNMPFIGGDDIVALVRQNEWGSKIRIVLYSGLPPAELEEKMRECGADGYISKTPSVAELIRQVKKFL